jgi:hypothetical protein
LGVLALIICAGEQAKAYTVVVASNLGAGGTYGSGEYIIQGNPVPGMNVAESYAVSFVASSSAVLQDVKLPLAAVLGPPSIIVGIAPDNSGQPGSILAMLTQNGTISSSGATLVSFTNSAGPLLEAGTRYWVVTGAPDGNTFVYWYLSNTETGNYDFTSSGSVNGPWSPGVYPTPAFQVDGLIPGLEPQTITFDTMPNQLFGVSPFVVVAHASSNLPVTIASTTPAVCKMASGLLEVLAAGTCSLTASQSGSATYSAAPSVTRNLTVGPAKPSGTLAAATGSPLVVGVEPLSVAVGDFNGDGIPDLAFADGGSEISIGFVSVMLGNGAGGFTPAVNSPFSLGSFVDPSSIAVGDFNGDGHLDLVTANTDDTVSVLLGDGLGGFTLATGSPIAVGGWTGSVAVGDFNGDGIQDLALAMGSDGVGILLGNGKGGFTPSTGSPIAVGGQPFSVAVGDFNGDGIQDLAIADGVSNVAVLLGNGSGGFTAAAGSPIAVGVDPVAIAIGDFNGDGYQDLATANSQGNSVTVLLGNGSGGFTPAAGSPYQTSIPHFVAVGDFNGDGLQDLAIANGYDNVTIMLGNGAGGFAPGVTRFTTDLGPVSMAVADFNGDGFTDIVTANSIGNDASVLLGGKVATASVLSTTSPPMVNRGQTVQLTSTVSDANPAFSLPTGAATFFDGANALGVASQSGSPFTFAATSLGVGPHTLTARYGGDTTSLGSTSNSIALFVNSPACDLTHVGGATVGDVQTIIDQALGTVRAVNDLNGDGAVNVVDVQIEINAALGVGCSAE